MSLSILAVWFISIAFLFHPIRRLLLSPLRPIPGPTSYALSSWRIAYDDLKGHSTRQIHSLHNQYGPVVRIGPTQVSFNSLEAIKTIYGAGSRSQRTAFYKLFEPYGKPTMFTMASVEDHRARKQLLARPYAKTHITRGSVAAAIERTVNELLLLLEKFDGETCDMSTLLSFFALDNATAFVYGPQQGTAALAGDESHQGLLEDFAQPFRRKRSWISIHGGCNIKTLVLGALHGPPGYTLHGPAPFSRIRFFAMQAFGKCQTMSPANRTEPVEISLVAKLLSQQEKAGASLQDIDIASECADHLLAGIETTKNLLLFLIWALSLPENVRCQEKLRSELLQLVGHDKGSPSVEATDKLPYLNAVLKEALRLYAPLPSSQPRFFDSDVVIEGYFIPAKTTVSMSPYCLHRNPDVFDEPRNFKPERWLDGADAEMKKWWWPFSSGGRMCTGMQ